MTPPEGCSKNPRGGARAASMPSFSRKSNAIARLFVATTVALRLPCPLGCSADSECTVMKATSAA